MGEKKRDSSLPHSVYYFQQTDPIRKKKSGFSFMNCLEIFGSSFSCGCPVNEVPEISLLESTF